MSTTQSTGDESPSPRRRWLIIGSAGATLVMIAAEGLVWWNIDGPDHVTTDPLDEHPPCPDRHRHRMVRRNHPLPTPSPGAIIALDPTTGRITAFAP